MKESPFDKLRKRHEGRKAPEVFRASIGFDFIFSMKDGKRRCYCVEINGDDSGITGVVNLPPGAIDTTRRLITDIRNRVNPDYEAWHQRHARRIKAEFPERGERGRLLRERMMREIIAADRSTPYVPHAFQNAPFIRRVTSDKRALDALVPKEHRLRTYKPGESKESATGVWIVKPRFGPGGKGMHFLDNEEFEEFLEGLPEHDRKVPGSADEIVAQEFAVPTGADNAEPDRPASMRLLMDFVYREDGTIDTSFEAAYQRVSPHSTENENMRLEKVFVVNLARGAEPVPASDAELTMARAAAAKIIQKLAQQYKKESRS